MSENSSPKPLEEEPKTSEEEIPSDCVVEAEENQTVQRKEETDTTMTDKDEKAEAEPEQEPKIKEEDENLVEPKEEVEPMDDESDDAQNDSKGEESLLCDETVEDVDDDDTSASEDDKKTGSRRNDDDDDEPTERTLEREISCEVEISRDEKSEGDESRVATRRSQRRRVKTHVATSVDFDLRSEEKSESFEPPEVKVKSEESCPEDDDAESVTSELDSLTSESTLTTRSAHRRGARGGSGGQKPVGKRSAGRAGLHSRMKSKSGATQTKGKGRRIIFKKSSTKAPSSVARAVTSDTVYYRGQYFTKGDIVSVTDVDGGTFYAQLRGFLTDQFCEKSCVITWLLPTTHSPDPDEGFDPATYVVGPEEEFPRKLEYFTFVMHAPDDYFYYRNAPYPTDAVCTDQEYVLTRLGPKIRLVNQSGKAVYADLPSQ